MSKVAFKRLGDLITLKRGYDLPEKVRIAGPYPVISSSGVSGWHNEYKVEGPGVVTGRYGTLGEMYYVEEEYWPHNTALYVQDFKGNDPKYIYYLLSCLGRIRTSDKSAVPGVNRNELHEMAVPAIEDLTSQKKIREVLESIDEKIALNNRIIAELEAMAKTLYYYWFVQFDFPDANGKPYKTSGGKMEYNATLKREIPVGWNDSILGEFIELERGVTYSKEDVKIQDNKDTIGVLRATNVTGNAVDIDDLVLIPSCKASTSQMLRKFDVLIVMSSGSKEHVGKNGVYYFEKPNAFGAFCSKITPNNKFRYFINTFLQSEWFKSYINKQCMGTNINNLTNKHITKCEIICPASDVVELFENKMMPIYSKLASNTQENSRLTKLREWLLPLLMNGQVTVK
ncbi:restriction endonuclease subunit S [Klebsiella pneumoniae]|uniref:restriction endonuclease subunit S n=1 Tax=Klebsiella pneumoniae TaxID=573 RepID=UPI000F6735E7|nr:restriction endonuclease subunit S [Klebsiella pneumoniae]MCB8430825.1 restriction endonuclease subunit S [Klebsiella pneumoniae]MCB8455021.1 restriction endonuclease subunit S [Klebsiella pneumoniae]MCP5689919.1 restriction endonuclease subunit S [Klebsiella pneumoniae]RRY85343.1 restriction endonuclease subunit S [Klebsiella pneumoniae]RRZ14484.1 restriction endonuclease subunit S [Klebsiella pneumoniae]